MSRPRRNRNRRKQRNRPPPKKTSAESFCKGCKLAQYDFSTPVNMIMVTTPEGRIVAAADVSDTPKQLKQRVCKLKHSRTYHKEHGETVFIDLDEFQRGFPEIECGVISKHPRFYIRFVICKDIKFFNAHNSIGCEMSAKKIFDYQSIVCCNGYY